MKRLLLLLTPLLLAAPAFAQAPGTYIVKDSLYFTMDDGIQSPEEMVEEAEYVAGLCASNPYQALYLNCECLGGAFLQEREKLGPMTPQYEILESLTKSRKATCANTVGIAGDVYSSCMNYSSSRRELEQPSENESYCSCAANKAASDYTRRPRLNVSYISRIRVEAMSFCRNPENREIVARQTVRTSTKQ